MSKNKLLLIAGGILLILVIVTVLFSGKPKTETAQQNSETTPEPTAEFENTNTFPTTSESVQSAFPGNWYTHRNLVFKLPLDWKVTTGNEADDTVFAQPSAASSIYTLPRLQIAIDDTTASDYIKPEDRYNRYGVDNTIFSTYQNIDLAYRTPDPFDYPDASGNLRKIQEMVVILRRNDEDYRVIFQYESNGDKDENEKLFGNIIGSLHYQ
jgi:hypothetical protein